MKGIIRQSVLHALLHDTGMCILGFRDSLIFVKKRIDMVPDSFSLENFERKCSLKKCCNFHDPSN